MSVKTKTNDHFTSFHLNADELNADFFIKFKTLFKSKRISITVEEEMDETEYLLSTEANRKHLEAALKSKEGYAFTPNEFKKDCKDLAKGKKTDVNKLRKVKLR